MLTKNNWYTSNIKERLKNPLLDFKIDMNLYPFEMMDFDVAAKLTAIEISKNFDNLYLAYSGGYDSDFILRLFVGLGLPVTPVIVMLGNEKEASFALKTCVELNVYPDIIYLSEKEYINTLLKKTMTINGIGVNNVQTLTVAEYVSNKNGVLLTGNHLLGDDGYIEEDDPVLYGDDWDFYTEIFYPNLTNIDVLLYNPEIAFAPLLTIDSYRGKEWNEFRKDLYGLEYHEKFKPKYSPNLNAVIQNYLHKRPKPKYRCTWTKSQLLKML